VTEAPVGIVLSVFRGGCEVAHGDRVRELRLLGRHALAGIALAVGDEVSFDEGRGVVLELLPRRSALVRRRPKDDPRQLQVIAANMDRLAIVASVVEPAFRPGVVDRLQIAALSGGLDAILVVNKVDLLAGAPLPDEVRAFQVALPVHAVSARTGQGIEALHRALVASRTVLAGHSGVGKSSLLNALHPELRLVTGELRRDARGRHTTSRATLHRLAGDAIVVDTPGVREVATGPVEPALLERVYPDVAGLAAGCQFRDCRHDREPACAVRRAAEQGELSASRWEGWRRLVREIDETGGLWSE
jgi:ribosome biogenesis GTPase